jgi:prepilin-type N-terminal cleavage/methylation domain-containing protein
MKRIARRGHKTQSERARLPPVTKQGFHLLDKSDTHKFLCYLKTALGSTHNAFTLAEVLITSGIIGVVAALTMPSLIANYQGRGTVTKLKKAYSTFTNDIF